MRLLLDTQVFLWFLGDSRRLSHAGRALINEAEEVYVSAASIWEVAIKASIGKLKATPEDVCQGIDASGFTELPVRAIHATAVAGLPPHHRDPFDRLLVAQALLEPLLLVTADSELVAYSPLIRVI